MNSGAPDETKATRGCGGVHAGVSSIINIGTHMLIADSGFKKESCRAEPLGQFIQFALFGSYAIEFAIAEAVENRIEQART